jgi:hypothetical protein
MKWWEETGQHLPQNNFDLAWDAWEACERGWALTAINSPDCDTTDMNPDGIRNPCNCRAGKCETIAEATLRSVLADLVEAYERQFNPNEVTRDNMSREDWIEATVAYRSAKAVLRP